MMNPRSQKNQNIPWAPKTKSTTAPKIENPTQSSRPRFKENEGRSEKMLKFKLKYIGLWGFWRRG